MSDVQKKFYVLRAISGKENKAKEYLEAEIKNTDLGEYVSQVLIPTEKTFTVRNGKKVMKERAYLPGYVLVEAALVGEVAHRLRNIPNIIGFLGGSDNPVPLRPAEVNRILGTVDEMQEQPEDMDIQFVVGENVKITGCLSATSRSSLLLTPNSFAALEIFCSNDSGDLENKFECFNAASIKCCLSTSKRFAHSVIFLYNVCGCCVKMFGDCSAHRMRRFLSTLKSIAVLSILLLSV